MLNKEALQKAEDLIKHQLGTLEDLPYELANTIANIYYKFSVRLLEMSEMKTRGESIPNYMKQAVGTNSLQNLLNEFITSHAQITSDVETVYEHVVNLRGIDKTQKPNLYQDIVDFILDCLKYNIKNVSNKSGVTRMIERKKKKVDEIPNLIDLMSFDNDDEKKQVEEEYDGNLVCYFCETNPPDEGCEITPTIYKVTKRSWFTRKVHFKYLNIHIPRCRSCQEIHSEAVFDRLNDLIKSDSFQGGELGKSKRGIKDTSYSTLAKHPLLIERMKEGWTFSKPMQ